MLISNKFMSWLSKIAKRKIVFTFKAFHRLLNVPQDSTTYSWPLIVRLEEHLYATSFQCSLSVSPGTYLRPLQVVFLFLVHRPHHEILINQCANCACASLSRYFDLEICDQLQKQEGERRCKVAH